MKDLYEKVMDGLIRVPARASDWVFQKFSGIVHEVRNSIRDWRQFRPSPERQSGRKVDAMACVSFSVSNCIEEIVNWMDRNGLLPKWNKDGLVMLGFWNTGEFNISDRDLAQASGTTRQGNYFVKVLDTARKVGFVAEAQWPSDLDNFTWEEYYKVPPVEVTALRKEALKYLEVVYEYVALNIETMSKALEHGPIAGSVPGHAVCIDHVDHKTGRVYYLDSYAPFDKEVPFSYLSNAQFKVVCSPLKENGEPIREKHVFTRTINPAGKIPGEQSSDVVALQQILGMPVTGVYDDTTRAGVLSYQLRHLLPINPAWIWEILSLRGRSAGPKTIKALNNN